MGIARRFEGERERRELDVYKGFVVRPLFRFERVCRRLLKSFFALQTWT